MSWQERSAALVMGERDSALGQDALSFAGRAACLLPGRLDGAHGAGRLLEELHLPPALAGNPDEPTELPTRTVTREWATRAHDRAFGQEAEVAAGVAVELPWPSG